LPASPLGKVKMFAQVVAILVLILGQNHMRGFFVIGQAALWVATIAALVSAVDYVRRVNLLLGVRPDLPAKEPVGDHALAATEESTSDRVSA
jgi:phosphatidylglycerophosphate synthase